jgi:hypothetical protein
MSIYIVEFAAIVVVVCNEVVVAALPKARVKVAAVAAVFVTAIFVTIAFVDAGTV